MRITKRFIVIFLAAVIVIIASACRRDYTLNTDLTDALQMDFTYGDTFIASGIGEVTLASCEDGDTAEFITEGQRIRVRFLGIDTPEASYIYEPWGYQATQFACDKLTEADTIVLEADGSRMDTFNRYLAYIWYDGRLLNLELVEEAYAEISSYRDLKYKQYFVDAYEHAQTTNMRIHEDEPTDPLFDYATEGIDVTIEALRTNPDNYAFKRVNIEGLITGRIGSHVFIEQNGYGMFFYVGHIDPSYDLQIGNHIKIPNLQFVYDVNRMGGWHLTGYLRAVTPHDLEIVSINNEVDPMNVTIEQLSEDLLGRRLKLESLTILSITNEWGHMTILLEDALGNQLKMNQNTFVDENEKLDESLLEIGQTVDIEGFLVESEDEFCLWLTKSDNITILE